MSNRKPLGTIVACIMVIIVVMIITTSCDLFNFTSTPTYTLSVSVNPPRAGSVSPAGGKYKSGEQVTLTATPVSDYTFDYWSGDATGTSNPVTITMDLDKSVTATFRSLLPEGILFQDSFDDDRNDWEDDDSWIQDGALHVQLSPTEEFKFNTKLKWRWPIESGNYPSFGYEVDISAIEVGQYRRVGGIVFLCDPGKGNEKHQFIFLVSSADGYYALVYYQIGDGAEADDWRTVVDWTASSFINTGTSTNRLKVICRNSVIELYANDHLLREVHGEFPDNIGDNGIGLFIAAGESTTHLVFDNMKMWVLNHPT